MPKYNPIYNKHFDQILLQLVEYMGDNKWAEITRRMKTIFGFDIPRKAMVQARWRAIDPKINRDPFTAEDLALHWQFCVHHKCNWDAVKAEYQLLGQVRDKSYLSQKFFAYFQYKLIDLNKSMGKIPIYNRQKIEQLRDNTKKRILELNNRDADAITDSQTKEIVISCKAAIKVLSFAIDNHQLPNEEIIDQLQKYVISRDKFQKMLENLFIIDQIVLIASNVIIPIDDQELKDANNRAKQKYRKPTQIKKWEDAHGDVSSDEFEEDKDILNQQIKLQKNVPHLSLTKSDIEAIKGSTLYQVCNTDQNMTFYDWYNEAKIQKTFNRLDYTYEIDIIEEQKKKLQQVGKKAKRQIKNINKKLQNVKQQKDEDPLWEGIKTKRGTLQLPDKEMFPGCYTKFFNPEDDESNDEENYDYMDIGQIYDLNYQTVIQQSQGTKQVKLNPTPKTQNNANSKKQGKTKVEAKQ